MAILWVQMHFSSIHYTASFAQVANTRETIYFNLLSSVSDRIAGIAFVTHLSSKVVVIYLIFFLQVLSSTFWLFISFIFLLAYLVVSFCCYFLLRLFLYFSLSFLVFSWVFLCFSWFSLSISCILHDFSSIFHLFLLFILYFNVLHTFFIVFWHVSLVFIL